jgi:hypothetical protein
VRHRIKLVDTKQYSFHFGARYNRLILWINLLKEFDGCDIRTINVHFGAAIWGVVSCLIY